MSGPPSPGYATNSDSSAHSSPLLPFDQKPLPSTSTNQGEEDGWGASGGYDDGEERSPQYGSHSNGTAGGSRADGAVGKNGGNQAQREHGDARPSEAGPSRKRPRIEDDSSASRNPSYSGTPQSQPQAQQYDHHHNNQPPPEPNSEIPLPHQIPLPDNSKSLYLLGLSDPEIQRRSPYQPVPRIIMHSIFGYTPRNEVSKEIGEWLLVTCRNLPGNVEVSIMFPVVAKMEWGLYGKVTLMRTVGVDRSRSSLGRLHREGIRSDYGYRSRPRSVSVISNALT